MSATFIIGIIFVAICALYGVASSMYAHKEVDEVIETEAGKISDCNTLSTYNAISRLIKLRDGRIMRTSDFIRIRITGSCMEPRNVLNGEEWLVLPIQKDKDIKSQIKVNDILLLYIQDKGIYKIRELRDILDDGNELVTGYYRLDGVKQKSSKNHSAEQVRGVVKYSI